MFCRPGKLLVKAMLPWSKTKLSPYRQGGISLHFGGQEFTVKFLNHM
jgi:hypothetical protein